MSKSTFYAIIFSIFCRSVIAADFIEVPADFSTIQEAINVAVTGDTVLVASDTYLENINFRGKNIVVASFYILDGDTSFICTTIINGSTPTFTDTSSCVLFTNG